MGQPWPTTGVSPTASPTTSPPDGSQPGERLPPQRVFARRRGIAGSTAGRVYGELVRRGLVVGEVGRGTFVRAAPAGTAGRALAEPAAPAPVNLELNYPSAPGQSELLAAGARAAAAPRRADRGAAPGRRRPAPPPRARPPPGCSPRPAGAPTPDRFLFTGNARQAIAAALASLVRPGGRVGVEALTYPLVKEIAGRLGIDPGAARHGRGGRAAARPWPPPTARRRCPPCTSSRRCTTRRP